MSSAVIAVNLCPCFSIFVNGSFLHVKREVAVFLHVKRDPNSPPPSIK